MTVTIRPWRPEDAPALAAVLDDPGLTENLRDGIPYPYTQEDAKAYIGSVLSRVPGELFAYAIVVDGELAGSISAERQGNIHHRTAELGYYLGRRWWGQGVMTRAVDLLCRRMFAGSDVLRIFAEPFARNAASCRVLEKAEFRYEGTLRCNAVKNGIVLDMKLYARLRPELCPEDCPAGCPQK